MFVVLITRLLLKGWDPVNRFNHTSWVVIVTQTDRPKSVRNRSAIEVYGGVLVLSRCVVDFPVDVGAFVIQLSQIFFHFSYEINHFKLNLAENFQFNSREPLSTKSSAVGLYHVRNNVENAELNPLEKSVPVVLRELTYDVNVVRAK